MKNALQEQLLKAGLATEEQLQRSQQQKRRPPQGKPKPRKGKSGSGNRARSKKPPARSDLAEAYAARIRAEKEEAAQKKRAKALRKANRAKIRQLILDNCLNDPKADIPFQFMVGTNIKNVYVTAAQREQLLAGDMQITFQDGKRCIIPGKIVTTLHDLDPNKLIINPAAVTEDQDDEYAEFKVPDDLSW